MENPSESDYLRTFPTEGNGSFPTFHAESPPVNEDDDSIKLFIGQIPKHMDEEDLQPIFDEFGPILELTVIRDKATKVHRGCAFLTYSRKQSAARAIHALHDKMKLPNAMNPLQIRPAESQAERENKIFVGMLPKTTNELDLHNMFAPFGSLKEIHIIRGPDGNSKGCAFVKFVERDSAMLAIQELNDSLPEGSSRPLVIKFADSKKLAREDEGDAGYGPDTEEYWMQQMQQAQPALSQNYPPSPPSHHLHAPPSSYVPALHSQGQMGSTGSGQSYMYYSSASHGQPYYDAGLGSPLGPMSPPHHLGSPVMYHLPSASVGYMDSSAGRGGHYGGGGYGGHQTGGGRGRGGNDQRPAEGPPGANLFIYHLPRDLTDADLATLFAPFGAVISAKVYVDKKTSESKGFGFVSYDAVHAAESAIEAMNGFQIGSKRLKVQHKRTGSGPGGGYSGGGGGYAAGYGGYGGGGMGGYRGSPLVVHSPPYASHGNSSPYYPVSAPPHHMSSSSRYAPQPVYDLPETGGRYGGGGHYNQLAHSHMQPPSSPGAYDPQYTAYLAQQQQQHAQFRDVPEIEDPRLRRKEPTPPSCLEDGVGRNREPNPHGVSDGVDGLTQSFDKSLRVSPADA